MGYIAVAKFAYLIFHLPFKFPKFARSLHAALDVK